MACFISYLSPKTQRRHCQRHFWVRHRGGSRCSVSPCGQGEPRGSAAGLEEETLSALWPAEPCHSSSGPVDPQGWNPGMVVLLFIATFCKPLIDILGFSDHSYEKPKTTTKPWGWCGQRLKARWLGVGLEVGLQTSQPCTAHGRHPGRWDAGTLRRVLGPHLASTSPSPPFHARRTNQGQGGPDTPAFPRPACCLGCLGILSTVSNGKPNYRHDQWEESSPCCPKRFG